MLLFCCVKNWTIFIEDKWMGNKFFKSKWLCKKSRLKFLKTISKWQLTPNWLANESQRIFLWILFGFFVRILAHPFISTVRFWNSILFFSCIQLKQNVLLDSPGLFLFFKTMYCAFIYPPSQMRSVNYKIAWDQSYKN